ncbi:MAG: prephenate dehydrogenase/arogenate dehydrogenase family protein [Gemmatimonadota bacterium]
MSRVAAVVGLGLIGGSIARDLAARGLRVLGHDSNAAALGRAVEAGVVAGTLGDDLERIAGVDWLVLAAPVDAATVLLERVRPHLAGVRLVTDTGSTKRRIVAAAEALDMGATFVGSHPFTGDHRAGWDASRQGLFDDCRVFLCRTRDTTDAALGEAESLWSLCGARTRAIDAAAHDALLARTSHLPQVLSSALSAALAAADVPAGETGRGARGMLRLAGSDPAVWTPIALHNADNLAEALQSVEGALAALRGALETGDRAAVEAVFRAGAEYAGRIATQAAAT